MAVEAARALPCLCVERMLSYVFIVVVSAKQADNVGILAKPNSVLIIAEDLWETHPKPSQPPTKNNLLYHQQRAIRY